MCDELLRLISVEQSKQRLMNTNVLKENADVLRELSQELAPTDWIRPEKLLTPHLDEVCVWAILMMLRPQFLEHFLLLLLYCSGF